jgi:hypothetical protein
VEEILAHSALQCYLGLRSKTHNRWTFFEGL